MAPAANIEKADLMGILDAVAKQAEKLVKRLKTKACFSVSRLQLDTLELMDKTVARWPSGRNKSGFTILKWIMFMCKRMSLVVLA